MRKRKPASRPAQLVRAAGQQVNSATTQAFSTQPPTFSSATKEGQPQYEASWGNRQAQFEAAWSERETQYATAWNERRARFEAAWKEQQAQVEAALNEQQALFETLWSGKQALYQSAWDEQQAKFDAAWKERHAYFEAVWKEQQTQYESSWKERQVQIEAALKLVIAPTRSVGPEVPCTRSQPELKQQAAQTPTQKSTQDATDQMLCQLQKQGALLQAKFAEPLEKYTAHEESQDFATAVTQEHNKVRSMFADLTLNNIESSKRALEQLSHFANESERPSALVSAVDEALTEQIKLEPVANTAIAETVAEPPELKIVAASNATEAEELKAQISLRLDAINKSKDGMSALESTLLKSLAKDEKVRKKT
ncbi:hypothetical protein H4R27_001522 [Coemansia aciculifera]|uniref:Uncharacterized protein n=1 Tax=Coemansia pectinata TaxID=1052879 RepID=A0A9W8L9G1_9FUNG|nr:hypothetical protein GGI19_005312 [Coemansia pectinata]KAJ2885215.1 hypothetical protein H4R27_001522 [Coemansia aciculifera]